MFKLTAFRIVVIYALVGALWILLSDLVVSIIVSAPSTYTLFNIVKGCLYVLVTALLLYWLLHVYISERKAVEKALRESEAKFRALAESSPTLIFILRGEQFVYLNPAFEQITGYTTTEGLSIRLPDLIRLDTGEKISLRRLICAQEGGPQDSSELRLITKGGKSRWVYYSGINIEYEGKPALLGNLVDISELKEAEVRILGSLREKEVLLKEVHHRVKNNLQIISSLLSLQSSTVTDSEMIKLFMESQQRIRSMALLHEKLYQSRDLAVIDIDDYLRNLISYLYSSYVSAPGKITLDIAIEPVPLKLDTAIPCGLIVNELITNSLKYAFPGNRTGTVSTKLYYGSAGQICLKIADDGIGLPPEVDIRQPSTLGLQLVASLVDQLDGTIEVDLTGGTAFTITFGEKKLQG